MIYAAFDEQSREATASDVYQYDTGQVLELSGLPPDLGGVTVEVHYGYDRDDKAEARPATYDRRGGVWRAEVPDRYFKRTLAVNAYVYVFVSDTQRYTLYRVTWTPIARPAPSNEATEQELNAWGKLVEEVNASIAGADGAASRANAAAASVTLELEKLSTDKVAWEQRVQAVETKADNAVSTANTAKTDVANAITQLNTDKAAWERRVQTAETNATNAVSTANSANTKADNAVSTANSANTKATNAVNTANSANTKADSAVSTANSAMSTANTAKSTADSAYARTNSTLYQQIGPTSLSVDTSGWTYDSARDRYHKNHAISGCTAAMIPAALTADAGQNFPLCGVSSYNGGVTLYMADTPIVAGTVVVRLLGVR